MTINWKTLTTSWKSSAAGIASIAIGAIQLYRGGQGIAGAIHDPVVQLFFVVGVLGLVTKDGNVTGGSKGQPSTVTALAAANQAPATGPDRPKQVV
jgi:hypothetical protein